MTLQASGAISLSQIAGEFGGKNPLELGEYRGQDNAPTTGAISFSNFYSTDGIPSTNLQYHYDGQISEHSGTVQDLSSNNYSGTFTNGASYNSGDFGKLVFDGVDDYVNLSGYNGVTGTTARTSIVFFKLDSNTITSQQRLLTWGDSATNGGKWAMELNTSNNFNMGVGGGARQSTKTLTVNGWNMLSATWAGSTPATPDAIFDFIEVGTVVTGTGVPNNTTVTAFNSSSRTITLSNNLTTTISGATLTFTNNHLTAGGGSRGNGGGGSGGSGGSSGGISRTNGGSGGSGGSGGTDGGGGAGAGGYTGNGGGENQNGSGGGGAGGANDGDGGGGVGIYGSGSSGTAPRGGGSGGASGQNTSGTGGDGGNYGGGGGGVEGDGGTGSGGDGGNGAVRFVWGSYSYPSNAANGISDQQTFTTSGTFTVPAGVTSVSAVVVGAGGGGGDNDPDKDDEGGGGGGGGALAYGSWTVSAGQQYTVTVGSGGNGGSGDGANGSSGGSSSISIADTNTDGASGTSGTNTITIGAAASNDLEDITLYHNAEKLVNYSTGNQTINTTTSTNVAIGRANAGTAGNMDGQVAKVLIYNSELTHAQIAQIYNAKCVALGLSQASLTTETLIVNDIEYVTGTTSRTTSISLSSIQSGDLLLLFGATDSGNMSGTDPSGWTELTTNNTSAQPDNDNLPDTMAYYRFATGTSESVTGLTDPNSGAVYVMMAFRNVNTTTPLNTTSQEATAGSGDPNSPSITTTANGCMIVSVGFLDDDDSASGTTAPSGYTLGPTQDTGANNNSGATIMTAYLLQSTAGAENPGGFSTPGDDAWKAYTIALNPT